jgi:hypothetical protein
LWWREVEKIKKKGIEYGVKQEDDSCDKRNWFVLGE